MTPTDDKTVRSLRFVRVMAWATLTFGVVVLVWGIVVAFTGAVIGFLFMALGVVFSVLGIIYFRVLVLSQTRRLVVPPSPVRDGGEAGVPDRDSQ